MSKPMSLLPRAACQALFLAALGAVPAAVAQSVAPAETVLHLFGSSRADGIAPVAAAIQGSDGAYYGTTLDGGDPAGGGTVYRLSQDGVLTTLHAFDNRSGSSDGFNPRGALVEGADGRYYGSTEEGGAGGRGTVFSVSATGVYQIVHSFDGSLGAFPRAGLVRLGDALYGVAASGGPANNGTVFRIAANGTGTLLHGFVGSDGAAPSAALVTGSDGALYGTTLGSATGDGTVFRITPAGALTVLHRFTSDPVNGYHGPGGNGVVERNGLLFGSTPGDAGFTPSLNTAGSLYQLLPGAGPDAAAITLHRFSGADGAQPTGLVSGQDGLLYGSTRNGGESGIGTLFRIAPAGTGFERLHQFPTGRQAEDGARPNPLSVDRDGTLIGTSFASTVPRTLRGEDPRNGQGAVFALYPRVPAVSVTVTPAVAAAGQQVSLSWTADAAASDCQASGAWRGARAASGVAVVEAGRPGEAVYTLRCSNPAGEGSGSATLSVAAPPVIALSARPAITNDRNPSTVLAWTAAGASECTASGAWSGPRPLSSSQSVTPALRGANRYTLSCTGIGGSSSESVTVFRSGTP